MSNRYVLSTGFEGFIGLINIGIFSFRVTFYQNKEIKFTKNYVYLGFISKIIDFVDGTCWKTELRNNTRW